MLGKVKGKADRDSGLSQDDEGSTTRRLNQVASHAEHSLESLKQVVGLINDSVGSRELQGQSDDNWAANETKVAQLLQGGLATRRLERAQPL